MSKSTKKQNEELIQKVEKNIIEKQDIPKEPTDVLLEDLNSQEMINSLVLGIIPETFAKDYKKLKKLQDQIAKTEKEIKDKLIQLFKEHPEIMDKSVSMDGLKFTYSKEHKRTSVDGKKLKEEYPEIYKKVIKETNVDACIKTYVEF